MKISEMRQNLIDTYGPIIRGQQIKTMPDYQVMAIWYRVQRSKAKPKVVEPKKYEQLSFLDK